MAGDGHGWFDRTVETAALRRWRRLARTAPQADPGVLRDRLHRARQLKQPLDRLIRLAEERLATSLGSHLDVPRDTDWTWRPEPWCEPLGVPGLTAVESGTRLGRELAVFHDCPHAEIVLRQVRDAGPAPCALRLEVLTFGGSYLSLALDIPEDAGADLSREHVIRLDAALELERPTEIFARLNIRHGPNTEQIVREVVPDDPGAEFDLAYSGINEKRVSRIWLDLIFDAPAMNQVLLRDLIVSRRRRAAF